MSFLFRYAYIQLIFIALKNHRQSISLGFISIRHSSQPSYLVKTKEDILV